MSHEFNLKADGLKSADIIDKLKRHKGKNLILTLESPEEARKLACRIRTYLRSHSELRMTCTLNYRTLKITKSTYRNIDRIRDMEAEDLAELLVYVDKHGKCVTPMQKMYDDFDYAVTRTAVWLEKEYKDD